MLTEKLNMIAIRRPKFHEDDLVPVRASYLKSNAKLDRYVISEVGRCAALRNLGKRDPRNALCEVAGMSEWNSEHHARAIASELENMVAWADERQDFVLSAWLAQALSRVTEVHTNTP